METIQLVAVEECARAEWRRAHGNSINDPPTETSGKLAESQTAD
jgi:hypothetical protein